MNEATKICSRHPRQWPFIVWTRDWWFSVSRKKKQDFSLKYFFQTLNAFFSKKLFFEAVNTITQKLIDRSTCNFAHFWMRKFIIHWRRVFFLIFRNFLFYNTFCGLKTSFSTCYRYWISWADKKTEEETKNGRILRRQRRKVVLDFLENGPLLYGTGIDDSVWVEKKTRFFI